MMILCNYFGIISASEGLVPDLISGNFIREISAANRSDQCVADGNILNENKKTWKQENRFFTARLQLAKTLLASIK